MPPPSSCRTSTEVDADEFTTLLAVAIAEAEEVQAIRTHEEEGVVTANKPIVVRLADGSEFQVFIKAR